MKAAIIPVLAAVSLVSACKESAESHFAKARTRFEAENYAGARAELLEALKIKPNDRNMVLWLLQANLLLGDGDGALANVKRARSLGVPAAQLKHAQTEALMLLGKLDEAQALLGQDRTPDGMRLRAVFLLSKNKLLETFALYDSALNSGANYRLAYDYGSLLLTANDLQGATRMLGVMRQLRPQGLNVLQLQAAIANRQGQESLALAALQDANKRFGFSQQIATALAEQYERMGQLEEASKAIKQAAALGPSNAVIADIQLRLARGMSKWKEVRAQLQGGEAENNPLSENGLLYCEAMLELGNYEQARAQLAAVVDQQPNNYYARNLMARAMLAGNDPAAAYETMKPVIDSKDVSSDDLNLMAKIAEHIIGADPKIYRQRLAAPDFVRGNQLLLQAGKATQQARWAAAQTAWAGLDALRPGDPQTISSMAYAAAMAGAFDIAINAADRAVALAENDPYKLMIAGMARARAGRDLPEARSLLTRSLALAPSNAEAALYLYKLGPPPASPAAAP